MDKYVYGMYGSEDQLDNNDRLYNKFLDIFVLHPRTHIKFGKAVFTDYEIHVKTNHPEFAIKDSCVRRRYSEFAWLKARLGMNDVMMTTAPSLPGKRYIGRFKDPFLMKRQMGLQNFMNKVVEINPFLSDPALHLFLQTDLSITQMESYLKHGVLLSNIRDRVIAEQKLRHQKGKTGEVGSEFQCYEHTCTLSRSYSLDTILSLKREEKMNERSSGRGWSNYIGDGFGRNQVMVDKDMTDFHNFAPKETYQKQAKKTACVLPGGQLQLADEQSDSSEVSTVSRRMPRPSSWHGTTLDVVDLWLDSYDVVDFDVASKQDSLSLSHNSVPNSFDGTLESYSDDGIELDILSCLSEYTIIPPLTNNGIEDTSDKNEHSVVNEQINHRKLQSRLSATDIMENGIPHRKLQARMSSMDAEDDVNIHNKLQNRLSGIDTVDNSMIAATSTNESTYASLDTEGFRHSDSDSFSS